MIKHSFNILPNQDKRIIKAWKRKKGCQIKVKKGGDADKELLVTPQHLIRFNKAPHGAIVTLPFKHEHLKENHKGGFLPLLAAALAPVIGGVIGGVVEKEISGSGLTTFRGKPVWRGPKLYTVEKRGSGMFLNPWMGPPINM